MTPRSRQLIDDALKESGWDKAVFLESKAGAGFALYHALQIRIEPLMKPWYQRFGQLIVAIWDGEK